MFETLKSVLQSKGNEKKASLSDLDDIRDQNRIPASCTGSRQ